MVISSSGLSPAAYATMALSKTKAHTGHRTQEAHSTLSVSATPTKIQKAESRDPSLRSVKKRSHLSLWFICPPAVSAVSAVASAGHSSSAATSACPSALAEASGVSPHWSLIVQSAPLLRRKRTTPRCPAYAAMLIGVWLLPFTLFTSAFASSTSSRTTSSWPFWHAANNNKRQRKDGEPLAPSAISEGAQPPCDVPVAPRSEGPSNQQDSSSRSTCRRHDQAAAAPLPRGPDGMP